MTITEKQEVQTQAIQQLQQLLPCGSRVYLQRVDYGRRAVRYHYFKVLIPTHDLGSGLELRDITPTVALALGVRRDRDSGGIITTGDELVSYLSIKLGYEWGGLTRNNL